MPENMLYLNGEFMALNQGRVSVEDRGFQFGDGVYEVVKVLNGRLLWLEEHLARLQRSLSAILMEGALVGQDLPAVLTRLLGLSQVREGFVYLQITRGVGARDFLFPPEQNPTVVAYVRPYSYASEKVILAGVALHPVDDIRWSRCDVKVIDLLAGVLAKKSAWEAGCAEALWVGEGVAREGGSSNFFAVVEGALRTHPLDQHVLDGVTRRVVLELAAREGLALEERAVTIGELSQAEEAFVTSTISDVMPVVSIGGRAVGRGTPGPVTLRLADGLRAEIARLAGLPEPGRLLPQL